MEQDDLSTARVVLDRALNRHSMVNLNAWLKAVNKDLDEYERLNNRRIPSKTFLKIRDMGYALVDDILNP